MGKKMKTRSRKRGLVLLRTAALGLMLVAIPGRAAEVRAVRVTEGDELAQPLESSGEFPAMVIQMVSAGEESGDLGGMMNKVADFYDRDIEYAVKRLTPVMEFVLILVVGAIVGLVAISMYMPIFNLTALLKQGRGSGAP